MIPPPRLLTYCRLDMLAVAIIADITHKSVNSHVPGQVETDLEHSQNPVTVQQRAEAQQSPQSVQTPQQVEQERVAKMRELIAANLRQTLNDAGYDITVGEVPVGKLGPTLILHGDIYKDPTIRMESLQMLRSRATNERLCFWGFRQVNIGSMFSNSDYSLHCAGQVATNLGHSQNPITTQQRAEAQQSAAQSVQTPQQTSEELEQKRLAKARQAIVSDLQQTLRDAGYDISVDYGLYDKEAGFTLVLHGDIYKDTTTRVESLQMLRRIANDRLCPWGFRQVNIGGLFSNSDYSLNCRSGKN